MNMFIMLWSNVKHNLVNQSLLRAFYSLLVQVLELSTALMCNNFAIVKNH